MTTFAGIVIVGPGVRATIRSATHMGSSSGLTMGSWNSRKLRKNGKWVISRIGGYTSLGFLGRSSLRSNRTLLFRRGLRFKVLSGLANGVTSSKVEARVCIQSQLFRRGMVIKRAKSKSEDNNFVF
ncbi:hypothetical protein Tco_0744699 [Tanacetum coccineum]